MQDSQKRVRWVYESTSNAELEARYDQWADMYEQDLASKFAWNAPERTVAVFSKWVQQNASILDAGAGTGLVGEALIKAGYRGGSLTAIDLSRGMLAQARRKGIYRHAHQMALGEPLDFPDDIFDAAICVGVFTQGHAPAHALRELVRITRPGGHIVFSLKVDTYKTGGFRDQQEALVAQKAWLLEESTERFQPLPKGEPEVWHQIWAYRVT